MFKLLYNWLLSLFTSDKIGILVRKLLINTGNQIAKDIFNVEHQKKAYEFVKELNQRTDLTSKEKAMLFNKKMLSFLKASGIAIAESALNCLRELAVNAVKTEENSKENNNESK